MTFLPKTPVARVYNHGREILRIELPQFHQDAAAIFAEWRMAAARWIPDVEAGRVVAVIV